MKKKLHLRIGVAALFVIIALLVANRLFQPAPIPFCISYPPGLTFKMLGYPPTALTFLSNCPTNSLRIVWFTSSGNISAIDIVILKDGVYDGLSFPNTSDVTLPWLDGRQVAGMNSQEFDRLKDLLPRLPIQGYEYSNPKKFTEKLHIAFSYNGSLHICHYPKNALPPAVRDLFDWCEGQLSESTPPIDWGL